MKIFLNSIASKFEQGFAMLQGKGRGATSVRSEVKSVARVLKNGIHLAVDIGANKGSYSAHLRKIAPKAEIHAFEPSAENINVIESLFEGDQNFHLKKLAVSNSSGSATLYSDYAGSGLASLTKRNLDHLCIDFNFVEEVQKIRFEDYWISVLGSRTIDLLKLDIEGHEMDALAGCGFAVTHSRVIQFEFGGCNIDTRTFFFDFWIFFADRNFRLYRISPFGLVAILDYREIDEFFITTNYLAVNLALI